MPIKVDRYCLRPTPSESPHETTEDVKENNSNS